MIKFEVIHYGTIIEDYNEDRIHQCMRYRIYQYKNKLYLHIMLNGEDIMFKGIHVRPARESISETTAKDIAEFL